MPAESLPDQTLISTASDLDRITPLDPFLERIEDTVRRFGERSSAPVARSDRHPASFSVARVTTDRKTTPESLKRKNTPSAIRSRFERLGISSGQFPNAIRDRPVSFAPISSIDEARDSASLALERILGRNDLIGIDFLESASKASRPVGRISIKNRAGRGIGFGTGFMVSPRLLMTNNHVMESPEIAMTSKVEFGFEAGLDGKLRQFRSLRFSPDAFFLTDKALDFTLIAIDPGAVSMSEFGWLPMADFEDGSVLVDEFVNIVQHPNGQPKQIAIRDNQVIDILPDFLHYRADTQPGSSGSPVFTDQWELVALHHSGIPRTNSEGQILTRDGQIWEKRMGDGAIDWIANEGVRIERILAFLNAANLPDPFRIFRDELHAKRPQSMRTDDSELTNLNDGQANSNRQILPSVSLISKIDPNHLIVKSGHSQSGEVTFEIPLRITLNLGEISSVTATDDPKVDLKNNNRQEAISIDPDYDSRKGYDSKFLGTGKNVIALPKLPETMRKRAAINARVTKTADASVFAYHHFSLVFDTERKLAIYTAVNIDGLLRMNLKRDDDRWIFDPRLPREHQAGQELYSTNEFDLGHLVRRLDPAWGKSEKQARLANDDTFHFTNCAPQHELFNRGKNLWAGLEDHLLNKAGAQKNRMTIFTGPVLREDDPLYRKVRIPREYWKIAAYVKPDGGLVSAAFLVSQAKLIEPVVRTEGTKAAAVAETFQTTVADIERLTGLDFGRLRQVDVKRRAGVSFAPGQPPDRKSLDAFEDILLG